MYKDSPILITGCARSGTSMTAGIIDGSGAFGGDTSPPNYNNEKGMFENFAIRNQMKKPYLRGIKVDPMGQDPLPDLTNTNLLDTLINDGNDWRSGVMRIMNAQGYDGQSQWYYKGAKMCLVYPLWHSAFPNARWIIVRREREDIVGSCMRTGFMHKHTTERGWDGWARHHEKLFGDMRTDGLNIVSEMWPQKMINGDFSEMKLLIEKLGLEFDGEKASEFVSPELWKRGRK